MVYLKLFQGHGAFPTVLSGCGLFLPTLPQRKGGGAACPRTVDPAGRFETLWAEMGEEAHLLRASFIVSSTLYAKQSGSSLNQALSDFII